MTQNHFQEFVFRHGNVKLNQLSYYSEEEKSFSTRLHSSRMHTARLLAVSPSMYCARGVSALEGCVCSGGVSAPRGCLLPGGGLLPGGVSASRGVCLLSGGIPSCTEADTPPHEQNDRQVQKYYLAPNFVCGR